LKEKEREREEREREREREKERERLSRYVAVVFHSLPRSSILAEVTLFRELGLTSTACLMLYMTS
jgi:ribonuclease PH